MVKRRVAAKSVETDTSTRPVKKKLRSSVPDEDKLDASLTRFTALLEDALLLAGEFGHLSSASEVAALRHARNVATSILNYIPEDVATKLDFEGKKTRIDSLMRELRDSIPYRGDETQAEYVCHISEEIGRWLPDIWHVLHTRGEFLLARACIVYCANVEKDMANCRAKVNYDYIDVEVCVKNEAGEVVYEATTHLSHALTWIWKELLVVTATQGPESLSSTILADLQNFNETERVFSLIINLDKSKEPEEETRFDNHWTPEMHTASEELIRQKYDDRIAQFAGGPNLALFDKLVNNTFKPSLLQHIRRDLASESPKIPVADAVEIFKREDLIEDVMPLIPSIHDSKTLCAVVDALGKACWRGKKYSILGLKLAREGLANACTNVTGEIGRAFPGLEDAEGWLKDEVHTKYSQDTLQKRPKQLGRAVAKDIERIRVEFVKRASGSQNGNLRSGNEMDEETPSLSQCILDWSQTLVEWPNRAEAEEVWDAVRWKTTDDPFGVNGILMKMSDHCESRRPYLCQGIRTMIKMYACENVGALAKYFSKRRAM